MNGNLNGTFLSIDEVIDILQQHLTKIISPSIPPGKKENVYYLVNDEDNIKRQMKGKSSVHIGDCGVWTNGGTVNSHYRYNEHN